VGKLERKIALAHSGSDGLLANLASVVVRPDAYLAHVRPANDESSKDRRRKPWKRLKN
jgi:hypothetical protein